MNTAIRFFFKPGTRVSPTDERRFLRRVGDVPTDGSAPGKFTWENRRPGTTGFARWSADVGRRISRDGIAAHVYDVNNLVSLARQMGVPGVDTDVLADPSQPEPTRYRAFAQVVAALVNG